MQFEKKTGDPLEMAGASILASLSNFRERLKGKSLSQNKAQQGTDVSAHSAPHDNTEMELDGQEGDSAPIGESDKAAGVGESDKNQAMECDPDANAEADNVNLSGMPDFLRPLFRILAQSSCKLKLSKSIFKQVLEERNGTSAILAASTSGMSVRCAVFKEEVRAAILDGKDIEVSFDHFPYYLRYDFLFVMYYFQNSCQRLQFCINRTWKPF